MTAEKEIRAALEAGPWKCFHCGDTFDTERSARQHFGAFECSDPACKIKAGAEMSMLEALRRAESDAEDAIHKMHDESAEGWRAYHSVAGRLREQVEAAALIRDLRAENERLRAERDAAFTMSRCECGADEACANIVRVRHAGIAEGMERAAVIAEKWDGRPCRSAEGWTWDQVQFYDAGQFDASLSIASAIRTAKEVTK